MFEQFTEHIKTHFPFLLNSKNLLAISGGIDSVVLTHLLKQLNLDFSLAHCNFNLRGKESDLDEAFVLELAEELETEVFVESFDTNLFAKQNKLSHQMAARKLRYNWFNELAEQLGFDFILTAHHADDDLETFLINLSRGTGLDGLTGIPSKNGKIIRPLLPYQRAEIEAYANSNNLKYREDSSNLSAKYLRNKLRLEVIPNLKQCNPNFLQNFIKTQEFLRGSASIISDRIDDLSGKLFQNGPENSKLLSIKQINELSNPKVYLFQFLKDYGFTEWNDVAELLSAQSGKQIFSKTHRLLKDRDFLILTENISEEEINPFFISESDSVVNTSLGKLTIEPTEQFNVSDDSEIYVDKDLLNFPLTVRKWEKGDYFYPFGLKGKKKLSKFFKDEKLSLIDKESTLLLCSGNDVVWVVGRRLDDRFKVTSSTQNILKMSLKE